MILPDRLELGSRGSAEPRVQKDKRELFTTRLSTQVLRLNDVELIIALIVDDMSKNYENIKGPWGSDEAYPVNIQF